LTRWLEDRLSFAKLPKRIVFVEEMPKGPTGKLQRIGLAERLGIASVQPDDERASGVAWASVEPSPETVRRVLILWEDALELPHVGLDDEFLDVGGDSLTSTRLLVGVREEFGTDVPLMAFFSASTVRAQARLIEAVLAGDASPSSLYRSRGGPVDPGDGGG
jgi:acyl carrier protein